jgi:Fic family protein
MKIPPAYGISSEILVLLSKIDAIRIAIQDYELPKELSQNIRQSSLLKSSLYSARIEGNTLTEVELPYSVQDQQKKEIYNIISASELVTKTISKDTPITTSTILIIHREVMRELSDSGGEFRNEVSAIFNQAGVAIYMTPPPITAKEYLSSLLSFINSEQEQFPLVCAFISHLVFEKIHPFLDGNGRVGRVLIEAILRSKGYDFGITVPFEEYLDTHREDYYYFLGRGLQKTEEYLLFMLEAYLAQSLEIKGRIMQGLKGDLTDMLPIRQQELFNIIRDHKIVSLDFLQRRFLKVPGRTLRYDLKSLADKGIILKIGKTKGVYYRPK